MGTQPYYNDKGERVPGTTTVIGASLGWSKNALMYWAWSQGKEGKNFRETSQAACDAGTLAHAMCEADITGKKLEGLLDKPYTESAYKLATGAYKAFTDWRRMSKLEIIHAEKPFVSEKYQFGGTIDAIGQMDGKICLIDFKTSNGTYADHLIQLAAYSQLLGENGMEVTGGIHLLRFGKDEADFHHSHYRQLDKALEAFVLLRQLYDLKKPLEKLAA